MARAEKGSVEDSTTWRQRMTLQAWAGIAAWMSFGLLLESLMAYKVPDYLGDPQRRELFRLAHAHGTLLNVVLLAAALTARRATTKPARGARFALRAGSVAMPAGFLLAGVWHPEGDPGFAIWLVPPGALLVMFGAISMALALRRRPAPKS